MSTVIRDGIIRISLQQGTVELKAPDIAPIIAQKKEQVAVEQSLMAAIIDGAAAEQAAAVERVAAIQSAKEAAAEAAERQQQAAMRVARAQAETLSGLTQIGEGFFQVGRAAALFSADTDQGLQRLVQTLATFQAGFDLFKGTSQVIQGATQVAEKLAEAERAAAAATAVATAATSANTVATSGNLAVQNALVQSLVRMGPALLTGVGVIAAAATAWKLYTNSVEEAERKQNKLMDSYFTQARERDAAIRQNSDSLKDFISIQEREAELAKRADTGADAAARFGKLDAQGPIDRQNFEYLGNLEAKMTAGVEAQREQLQISQQIARERDQALQSQAREIEQQQRIAEAAQKALDIEQKKVEAFEAQFGALNKADQKRLERIGGQLRDGGASSLKQSDVQFLAQSGGDQGRAIAQEEFARRGREQGAGNIFAGLANPALDQAASVVDRENEKLNDLTGGKGVGDALETIEDERQAIVDGMKKLQKDLRATVEPILESLQELKERSIKMKASILNS